MVQDIKENGVDIALHLAKKKHGVTSESIILCGAAYRWSRFKCLSAAL